jgi:amino acid transporter
VTPEILTKLVIASHVAILISAFTVLVKFSSLSSNFMNWRSDIEETLRNIKRKLAVDLGEKLKPIIENTDTIATSILGPDGNYCETAVSPVEGENYRNTLFDFINDKAHEMARYRSLLLAHMAYSFWARYLSYTIVVLIVVEAVISALIGYYGILNGKNISDILIKISFLVSGIGIIICFLGLVFLLINHNRGIRNRGCND